MNFNLKNIDNKVYLKNVLTYVLTTEARLDISVKHSDVLLLFNHVVVTKYIVSVEIW